MLFCCDCCFQPPVSDCCRSDQEDHFAFGGSCEESGGGAELPSRHLAVHEVRRVVHVPKLVHVEDASTRTVDVRRRDGQAGGGGRGRSEETRGDGYGHAWQVDQHHSNTDSPSGEGAAQL